jgi:hypothetical protein
MGSSTIKEKSQTSVLAIPVFRSGNVRESDRRCLSPAKRNLIFNWVNKLNPATATRAQSLGKKGHGSKAASRESGNAGMTIIA